MGPNRRAQDRERAAAEAAAKAKRAEAERKTVAEAQKIVAIWNARQAGGRISVVLPNDPRPSAPARRKHHAAVVSRGCGCHWEAK